MYDDYKKGRYTWPMISKLLAWSIPLPMLYILFYDFFLKPHIEFESNVCLE